jgi:hypothetical protein
VDNKRHQWTLLTKPWYSKILLEPSIGLTTTNGHRLIDGDFSYNGVNPGDSTPAGRTMAK